MVIAVIEEAKFWIPGLKIIIYNESFHFRNSKASTLTYWFINRLLYTHCKICDNTNERQKQQCCSIFVEIKTERWFLKLIYPFTNKMCQTCRLGFVYCLNTFGSLFSLQNFLHFFQVRLFLQFSFWYTFSSLSKVIL